MLRLLTRWSTLLTRLVYRARHPGARVSGSARVDGRGRIQLAPGVSIGDGASIQVKDGCALELGEGAYVGKQVEIAPSPSVRIGAHTSLQDRCVVLGDVSIGAHCIFAPNVYISSGRHWHDLRPELLIRDQDAIVAGGEAGPDVVRHLPVRVDEDCWLGINVVVLRGIHIGRGAVVGANSVVTRDVAPYDVIAGVPARPIGKRLDFLPPANISSKVRSDLPYFYAGFEASRLGLTEESAQGGMLAVGDFALALAPSRRRLVLKARTRAGSRGAIELLGQRRELSDDWQDLCFDVSSHPGWCFNFSFEAAEGAPYVVVASAWIDDEATAPASSR